MKNCNDDLKVENGEIGSAKKEEYLKGEEKINEILEEIDPSWSTKQKLAYVHYKMGELISYVPDFNFSGKNINSPISNNSRNIWKSVVDGKSVCNGVTDIERNILSRLGIKTRELSSATHSFLLTETEDGNIITDATWDLVNTLYKARPEYFGVTYENLRKQDGLLSNAHKLENPPENVIEISDEELREIYYSIGLTKENRRFLLPLLEREEEINSKNFNSMEEKLSAFFDMYTKDFSKEATHLSETRSMLEQSIHALGINQKDIITKFVYSKDDEYSENPYLIIHIDSEEMKNQIRLLNTEKMQFENMNVQNLDEKYKVHDLDTINPFWKKYLQEKEIQQENDLEKNR